MHPARVRIRGRVGALVLVASGSQMLGPAWGDDEPDVQEQEPGVFATFASAGNHEPAAVRVGPDLAENWENGSPDPRVPADGFVGLWTGSLP